MKVRLLPVLIISAGLAGGLTAVQADVQVMGHIDTSLDAVDVDGGSDDINMHCTTCSVGFKGSEDLGNGLRAIFKLDFQYDTTERNKDGSITDRDQWVGLAGVFGQLVVGTTSTGYKSHGAMIDPIYRTSLQGRDHGLQSELHSGAGEEGEGRATNTVRWDSPSWNGLKAVAHYTLDSNEDPEEDDPYGVGASYENGGILAFADYITNDGDESVVDVGELKAWKVGGKYSLNNLAVMAQYEDIKFKDPGDDRDGMVWHLGGSVTLGNSMLYVAYGKGEDDNSDFRYDSWTIAAMHSLSKRTKLYAGFNEVECDSDNPDTLCEGVDGESDQFSLGVKHKF